MNQEEQPQQPRLQHNPHHTECPDFGDVSFANFVQNMVGPNMTREQAIEDLRAAWHVQNERRKAQWDAQVLADREHPDGPDAPNPVQDNQDQIANVTEEAEDKYKLGAFSATTTIGDKVALKPSTFAINKLKEKKYIELYCFTPAGCRDHANLRLSTAEEAYSFSYGSSPENPAGSTLTLKPVSALSHPRKIIPDENLTWEQVRDAKACYLSHVIKAKWSPAHIEALMTFFVNLDSHPYSNTPEGKQALVWYQAHAREDWHQKLGTTDSFNLAMLNKTLLADFKKKASELALQNNVAQVSSRSPSLIITVADTTTTTTAPHRTYPHPSRRTCTGKHTR
jgi:hypothetical protein